MEEGDKEKTAFKTPFSLFEFQRMLWSVQCTFHLSKVNAKMSRGTASGDCVLQKFCRSPGPFVVSVPGPGTPQSQTLPGKVPALPKISEVLGTCG